MFSIYRQLDCQLNFVLDEHISKVHGINKNRVISWIKTNFELCWGKYLYKF